MRRCGIAAGIIGFAAWSVAQALLSIVIWLLVAVPFGLLLVLDALADERESHPVMKIVPPAPPRRPVALRAPARLAA